MCFVMAIYINLRQINLLRGFVPFKSHVLMHVVRTCKQYVFLTDKYIIDLCFLRVTVHSYFVVSVEHASVGAESNIHPAATNDQNNNGSREVSILEDRSDSKCFF